MKEKTEKTVKISIDLSEEEYVNFKLYCVKNRFTMSQLIREYIRDIRSNRSILNGYNLGIKNQGIKNNEK